MLASLASSFPPIVVALSIAALAALVSLTILHVLLATGLAWKLATDIPNARSMHTRPTPRTGGWGIVPAAALAIFVTAPSLWLIGASMLGVAIVSQVDDRRGLPARVRFAAHLAVAIAVVCAYRVELDWVWVPVLVIAIAWFENLYNFMDGADGLAGGMAAIGFSGYAAAAFSGPHPDLQLAWASVGIAGAALGFLKLNFHPARLFLGDAGSVSLGFLAGALGYWGWRHAVWPIWLPVMVFSPFIVDASVTLFRRLLRKERFWEAHREHYYQRLVRSGMSHAAMARRWYVVMALASGLALFALRQPESIQWGAIVVWGIVLGALGMLTDRRWRHFQTTTQHKERRP